MPSKRGQPALFSVPAMHCCRILNRVPNLIRHRLFLCSQANSKEVTPLVRSVHLASESKWDNTVDIRHYRFSQRFTSIYSASSDCRTPRSLSIYSEQRPDLNTDHCELNKRSEQIQLNDRADPNGHQVVVGLSGGVDSSVAAAVLHKEGYDVIGVTLWHMKGEGSCCSGGMFDAGRICDQLGIEHRVVDTRDDFKANIIDYVVQGYQSGISPLPCSQCNKLVKFRGLLDAAEDIGVSKVATGHYARVDMDPETKRYRLRRALDPVKDQAYFLFELSQDQLSRVVFPLGNQTKADTRRVAAELGLHTATKPESQDLCLVEAHGTMQNFLAQHIKPKTGNIVDPQGHVLGQHSGIHNFTVGQRKGLGVAADRPLYVIALDAEKNEVVVCKERSSGLRPDCTVRRVNWVSIARPDGPIRAQVQIRYRSPPVPATVVALDEPSLFGEPRARIIFDDPQFAVAPGQGAVFFDGDVVLGGGVIEAFPNPKPQPAATTTSSLDMSVSS